MRESTRSRSGRAVLEVLPFGIAAAAVGVNGLVGVGILFGIVASGNLARMFLLSQRDRSADPLDEALRSASTLTYG